MNITETHWITLAIFMGSFIVLAIWKELLADRVKKKIPIPIPMELIVIIIADVASYFLQLEEDHGVDVVGPVPNEIPPPVVPPYFRFSYITEAIPIVLVSFSICISMGKMLGKKYHYSVRANQEFLAVGVGNVVGAFFGCFTASTALSRTLVQSNVGGKSQIASLISSAIILIFILFLGQFLQPLPTAVLASVVVVNLKGMFIQFGDIPKFWRYCKFDAVSCSFFINFVLF